MKDFLNRHPIISLFMVDIVVTGIVNLVGLVKNGEIPKDPDLEELVK